MEINNSGIMNCPWNYLREKGRVMFSWKFMEEGSYYLLDIKVSKKSGFCEEEINNMSAIVVSPNSKVDPLRSYFILREDKGKVEPTFKIYRPQQNIPVGDIVILFANQGICDCDLETLLVSEELKLSF